VIGIPCPMGADHEALRHPDAMFCYRCVHLLPQRFRRAIRRANESREGRDEVLQRCRVWLVRRAAGILQEPPRPKPVVRYTSN
jgi:hypothetical protein